MESFTLKTTALRKFSQMTIIELKQAIKNLSDLNVNGRYNERIALYHEQISHIEKKEMKKSENFSAPPLEVAAIMKFNADKRFTITE